MSQYPILTSPASLQAYVDGPMMDVICSHDAFAGSAIWGLQDTLADGVVRDYLSHSHGAASGVTYYNSYDVSGTLSPNIASTGWVAEGMYNGKPYLHKNIAGQDWFNWCSSASDTHYWAISQTLGAFDVGWRTASVSGNIINTERAYTTGVGGSTGTATVTANTSSGIYLFIPTGLTPAAGGPIIAGEQTRGVGFDGVVGYVDCGAPVFDTSSALTFCGFINVTNPADTSGNYVFATQTSTSKRIGIRVLAGILRAGYYNGTAYFLRSCAITAGWHFIAVSKAEGSVAPSVFVDATIGAGNAPINTPGIVARTVIGANTNHETEFSGTIGLTAIIPAALTAGEINHLYQCARTGNF